MTHKTKAGLKHYFLTVQKTDGSHETHVMEVSAENEWEAARSVNPRPDYIIIHVDMKRRKA